MRLSRDEIYKKMTENGCHHTMSWSKFNTFIEDPYSFYLKYVHDPRIPEERQNSYAFLGDIVHNGLESLYDGSKTMDQIKKLKKDIILASNISFITMRKFLKILN